MRISTAGRSNSAGFTLVEIAVVMLIIGVFTLATLPRLADFAGLRIDKDAHRIARTVAYLYAQAAARGQVVRLSFDLETGEYFPSVLNDEDEFVQAAFPLFSGAALGGVTSVKSFTTAFHGAFKDEEAYLHFMPEGFAEEAVIVLGDRRGNAVSLTVDPLTGRTRITKGGA